MQYMGADAKRATFNDLESYLQRHSSRSRLGPDSTVAQDRYDSFTGRLTLAEDHTTCPLCTRSNNLCLEKGSQILAAAEI